MCVGNDQHANIARRPPAVRRCIRETRMHRQMGEGVADSSQDNPSGHGVRVKGPKSLQRSHLDVVSVLVLVSLIGRGPIGRLYPFYDLAHVLLVIWATGKLLSPSPSALSGRACRPLGCSCAAGERPLSENGPPGRRTSPARVDASSSVCCATRAAVFPGAGIGQRSFRAPACFGQATGRIMPHRHSLGLGHSPFRITRDVMTQVFVSP
jgi:hypothetical protein